VITFVIVAALFLQMLTLPVANQKYQSTKDSITADNCIL